MGTVAGGDCQGYLEHVRHAAMLQRNPVHTFMFDDKGTLLIANKSAIKASLHGKAGIASKEMIVQQLLSYSITSLTTVTAQS